MVPIQNNFIAAAVQSYFMLCHSSLKSFIALQLIVCSTVFSKPTLELDLDAFPIVQGQYSVSF